MSHFSTILKNMVASGITNTAAALVVLESFFEKNDSDSSDMTVQYRGNIADTNHKIASGLISEQDAQLAFAKVKAHTLDLISKVDDVQFDDAVIINYFAMLTPNPAKDPFFSPIAPEEQTAKAVAERTLSATESATDSSAGASSLWIIGGIGLFLVIGLIYLIVGFGKCTTTPQPSALAATSQTPVPAKPTDINKTTTTSAAQPATATSSSVTSTFKTPTTPTAKLPPEKPKAPEIKVKPATARAKVELIVDSLTTVNNTLNLKVAELKRSNVQLIELTKLLEKDPNQAAKRDEEKKKFATLSDEIRVLRSEIKRLTASLPK